MTRLRVGIGLGLVLLVAAALRIPSHNWDQDQHLHTDERYVTRVTIDRVQLPPGVTLATLLDAQHSPIDPRAAGQLYTYGALPIYLGKAATVLALAVSGDSYFSSYNGTQQTGRVLAGLFDILTTLLVFAAGRRLWGAGAGLRAAALYALAVLPIQIGHFYIAEPFMTTFMTATLLGSLTYYHTRRALPLLLAALCAGLATACKLQAAPILALPLITLFLHPGVGGWGLGVGGRERGWGWRVGGQASSERTGHRSPVTGHSSPNPKSKIQNPKSVGPKLLALLVLGLAGLGLLLGDPFAVLDAPTYLAQVSDQAAIQSGASDAFFTRQYVGTWPVLYPWGQLLLLGAGPVAGLVATGRLLAGLRRGTGLSRPAAGPALVLLAGGGLYFASIAFLEAKWLRYLLPLVPYLCLVAAAPFTWRILPEVQSRTLSPEGRGQGEGGIVPQPRGAGLDPVAIYGRIGVAGLLIATGAAALAFSAIYSVEHTRVQASRWIYAQVPAGRTIGLEAGDDPMPRKLPGYPAPETVYPVAWFDLLADHPPAEESALLRAHLAAVDYLLVGSPRVQHTVPHLPWRYPVQIRYYDLLYSGQLGFAPVYTATAYPTLLGIAIPDDGLGIDDTFGEYDHPPVHLFARQRRLTAAEWDALFATAVRQPWAATRQAP